MSRVGAADDNVAMEAFFSLLQKTVLNRHSWAPRDELRITIVTWIERTYHRRRHQARLGKFTPVELEAIMNRSLALSDWLSTVNYPCIIPGFRYLPIKAYVMQIISISHVAI